MGQTFGWYLAVFVAAIVLTGVRQLIRIVPGSKDAAGLSAYQAGYLAGGPRRTTEVIIAYLIGSGALRVHSDGRVSPAAGVADPAAGVTGPAAGFLRELFPPGTPGVAPLAAAYQRIIAGTEVAAAGREVRRQRLIISRARLALFWLAVVAVIVLLLVAARIGPTAIDGGLPGFTYFAILVVAVWLAAMTGRRPVISTLGTAQLKRLSAAFPAGSVPPATAVPGVAAVPGMAGVPGLLGHLAAPGGKPVAGIDGSVLFQVALRGLQAVPDPATRIALVAGLPRPRPGTSWQGSSAAASGASSWAAGSFIGTSHGHMGGPSHMGGHIGGGAGHGGEAGHGGGAGIGGGGGHH